MNIQDGSTNYFEKDGKYYRQNKTWWEKGGYYIPQTPKKISKEEYEKAIKKSSE